MPLSERTLRVAALACWENAASLSAEAKLLAEHDYCARAVALAILGLEEFAKAIGYAVAALLQEPRDALVKKLNDLTSHEVKHLLAYSSEYAQIATENWADGVEWETGFRPSLDQQFAARFCQLARGGLGGLLEEPREAKRFFKTTRPSVIGDDSDVPFGPDGKNAALYVDVTPDGEVKTPTRVAGRATSEIIGLDWFLEEYADLPCVLKDDAEWTRLAAAAGQGRR
jgi:AbiV family abortive infection protein